MAGLVDLLRRGRSGTPAPQGAAPLQSLFVSKLSPILKAPSGEPLVWGIEGDASQATITDQFKANAETYHQRYAASDHFQALFRQALDFTGIEVAERPLILDLGSGSGVNSIVPCARLFPGARQVATDLSGELLAMLAEYLRQNGGADDVICVKMDAMSEHVASGAFDLVTGASILHHLDMPERGIAAAGRALKPGGHAIFFEPFGGWAIVRLAFERILAEAELRKAQLDPLIEDALVRLIADVGDRSDPARRAQVSAKLDDKWLFSRFQIEKAAKAAGFAETRFVPHNDHASLYRDATGVHIRLTTGRSDLELPDWANAILDGFDAALNLQAKRELMLEGSIVLTKAA